MQKNHKMRIFYVVCIKTDHLHVLNTNILNNWILKWLDACATCGLQSLDEGLSRGWQTSHERKTGTLPAEKSYREREEQAPIRRIASYRPRTLWITLLAHSRSPKLFVTNCNELSLCRNLAVTNILVIRIVTKSSEKKYSQAFDWNNNVQFLLQLPKKT